ncbi:HK97 family phage prohead protease [Flavobacterium caeni]|uniref:Prohead serine protease n=1 Tax=Flavobacterium caeni TaxID=490189 RepID=A0A1G5K3I3_9FLAO|nr:HK97 family phage prohead protease [Flavobacterium caeni]SCY94630.1 prohead serine protease [Flavobacterium caeni]
MNKHTFVVNTENVNEYKYRVLTDGIDYEQFLRNPVVLYYHERYNGKDRGSEVIGRVVKLWIEDKKLLAEIEFDVDDEFAAKIAGKVERGFIRMASMYADVLSTSSAPEDLLPGQVYETVTQCKLIEISIVDIGGNDDALKLSKCSGEQLKLKEIVLNKPDNMSHLKTIALALGKAADTGEDALLKEIQTIMLAKTNAEAQVTSLTSELKAIKLEKATKLVDRAVELGLIQDVLKPTQIAAFDVDYDGQTAILSKLIADKELESGQAGTAQTVKEVVLNAKGTTPAAPTAETFDYLQKHNIVKLQKMKDENPTQYAKLHEDYKNGVRHTDK